MGNHPGRPRWSSSSLSQKENGRQIKIEKESSGNKRVAGFYTLSFYTHRDTQRVFFLFCRASFVIQSLESLLKSDKQVWRMRKKDKETCFSSPSSLWQTFSTPFKSSEVEEEEEKKFQKGRGKEDSIHVERRGKASRYNTTCIQVWRHLKLQSASVN